MRRSICIRTFLTDSPSLDFPVLSYDGTKSIVISTVSWVGGKNPFLGWAYIGAAALFILLAVAGLVRHLIKPRSVYFLPVVEIHLYSHYHRRLGDMSLLSWNR